MELTERAIKVLKNFAGINPSIRIRPGNELVTIAYAKNIFAKATIDCEFPQEFGIYNLPEFLATLSLVDKPNLKFSDKFVTIFDSTGRTKIKYFFDASQEKGITNINMPDCPVKFDLPADTLNKLKKAAGTLSHEHLVISPNNGTLTLEICKKEDKTANSYQIDIDADVLPEGVNFNFVFNIANLKMIDGDYTVEISNSLISRFSHKSEDIQYCIAVEKESTYN